MPDIQHLIELLKSDNPNKRYDACEELRVSRQPLPQDAIDALQFTTNDSNPDVADAAQRALALHTLQSTTDVAVEDKEPIEQTSMAITNKSTNWLLIGLLMGLVPALLLAYVGRDSVIGFVGSFCFGSLGIPFSLIGAYIGKRSDDIWIWAIVGAILGTVFGFAMLIILFPYT